ncbi:MAG: TatD family hydrolase [Candidatus Latescibacteria bacterium]|nr:TatD family hydrolase [Candidatus Latescibacterota bacterium]
MFTDTHVHLSLPEFDADREAVIRRAFDAGVTRLIIIGIDVETSRAAVALAGRSDGLFATVGIHPHEAGRATEDDFRQIADLARQPNVVGIGETGLDFYRNHSEADPQRQAFRRHIRLSRESGLPVIVHDREAHDEVLAILRDERADEAGAVLHCFTGDRTMAAAAAESGFFLSLGGVVTFKNTALAAVVPFIPLDRLLVETDAPYLAPVPFRGRRNEPAWVVHTATAVARILGRPVEQIADATSRNAATVFRLP